MPSGGKWAGWKCPEAETADVAVVVVAAACC